MLDGRQCAQHVGEPGTWIDAVQLGGHDQRVDCRCPLTTAIRSREEPCLPAQGYATQRSLGGVVRQTDSSVIKEPTERGPAFQHVVDRLRHLHMARHLAADIAHPIFQVSDEGTGLLLPYGVPLFTWQAVDRIRPPKTLDQARLRDDDLRFHFFARPFTA